MKIKPDGVKWRRSKFGMYVEYNLPFRCGVVIVCVMGGSHYQLHPVAVRLPHQVYYKDCKAWLKEHNATEIVLIPASHNDYVELGDASLRNTRRK